MDHHVDCVTTQILWGHPQLQLRQREPFHDCYVSDFLFDVLHLLDEPFVHRPLVLRPEFLGKINVCLFESIKNLKIMPIIEGEQGKQILIDIISKDFKILDLSPS